MIFRPGTPAQDPFNRSSRLRDPAPAPARPNKPFYWSVTVDFAADGERDTMTCRVYAEDKEAAETAALACVTAEYGGDLDEVAFTTTRTR